MKRKSKTRKIAVVTVARSDYGIYRPLLRNAQGLFSAEMWQERSRALCL